jgi:hypothetical protein
LIKARIGIYFPYVGCRIIKAEWSLWGAALSLRNVRGFVMLNQNLYETDYTGVYDQSFVFYDEEEDGYDTDDALLEEIPFVYCPSYEDIAQA